MFSFNAVYHIENNLRLENILWFLILCNSISDTFIIWFELTIQNFLKHVFEIALGHEFWLNINWDLIKSVSDKQKNKSSNDCNEFQWGSFCTNIQLNIYYFLYKTLSLKMAMYQYRNTNFNLCKPNHCSTTFFRQITRLISSPCLRG